MPAEPHSFALELSDHDLQRLQAELSERTLPAMVRDGRLLFTDTRLGRAVELWYGRLTDINRRLHEAAKREGRPLRRYKHRDDVDLLVALLVGLTDGGLDAVAHEVIWRQPFPNGNHRTVTAAILVTLGIDKEPVDLRAGTDPIFEASKRLLDGTDASLGDAEAKREHRRLMRRLVELLQSLK